MRLELYWSGLAAASIGSNSRSAQECIATCGVAVARRLRLNGSRATALSNSVFIGIYQAAPPIHVDHSDKINLGK